MLGVKGTEHQSATLPLPDLRYFEKHLIGSYGLGPGSSMVVQHFFCSVVFDFPFQSEQKLLTFFCFFESNRIKERRSTCRLRLGGIVPCRLRLVWLMQFLGQKTGECPELKTFGMLKK